MKAHIAHIPKVVLAWDLPEGSTGLSALHTAAALVDMKILPVTAEHLSCTVAQLCGLPASRGRAPEAAVSKAKFPTAAVFCGLSDRELDRVLASLRQDRAVIPLKATVTPTNQGWTLGQLLEELAGERDAIASGMTADHSSKA